MAHSPVYVTLEFTPNPNTLKYSINQVLVPKGPSVTFSQPEEARSVSELACQLFETPGVLAILLGKDFVTLTKSDEGDWELIHRQSSLILEDYLKAGYPIFSEEFLAQRAHASEQDSSEIEKRILNFLEEEIRPAVAMDGGDIAFERYENGVVYVDLQGSCSHCPSATATLKMGVEARLKEMIPEVVEVVAI